MGTRVDEFLASEKPASRVDEFLSSPEGSQETRTERTGRNIRDVIGNFQNKLEAGKARVKEMRKERIPEMERLKGLDKPNILDSLNGVYKFGENALASTLLGDPQLDPGNPGGPYEMGDIPRSLGFSETGAGDTPSEILGLVGVGLLDPATAGMTRARQLMLRGSKQFIGRKGQVGMEHILESGHGSSPEAVARLRDTGYKNVNKALLEKDAPQELANEIAATTKAVQEKADKAFTVFNEKSLARLSPQQADDAMTAIRKSIGTENLADDKVKAVEDLLASVENKSIILGPNGLPRITTSLSQSKLFQIMEGLKDFKRGGNPIAAKAVGAATESLRKVSKEYEYAADLYKQGMNLERLQTKLIGPTEQLIPGRTPQAPEMGGNRLESYYNKSSKGPMRDALELYGDTLSNVPGNAVNVNALKDRVKDISSVKGLGSVKPKLFGVTMGGAVLAGAGHMGVSGGVTGALSLALLAAGIPRVALKTAKAFAGVARNDPTPMASFLSKQPAFIQRVNAVKARVAGTVASEATLKAIREGNQGEQ